MVNTEAILHSIHAALLPVMTMGGATVCIRAALLLTAAVFAAGILKQAYAQR